MIAAEFSRNEPLATVEPKTATLALDNGQTVSALWARPTNARACFVFAHGAGAGMTHSFMNDFSTALNERRVATLRYQFPYMQQGRRRPDSPAVAHTAVRAAVRAAADFAPELPLFAGGKSFGGRMTSQAHANGAMERLVGLIFVSFPLHPAGKPSIDRANHLQKIEIPMLFLQGNRDKLADSKLLSDAIQPLGSRASLVAIDKADHSLHVLKRSGRTDEEVLVEAASAAAGWIQQTIEALAR